MKIFFNNNKNFLIIKIFIPVILFCGNKMVVWGWCVAFMCIATFKNYC